MTSVNNIIRRLTEKENHHFLIFLYSELRKAEFQLADSRGQVRTSGQRSVPVTVVKGGRVFGSAFNRVMEMNICQEIYDHYCYGRR